MDRLDKSLDELAKEKREEEKAKREKQVKVVKAAKPTVAKVQEQPRGGGRGGRGEGGGGGGGGRGSILSRVGESSGGRAAPISGTLVLFKNLKREVNDADVQELARTVGEIKKGEVITNHRNESTGVAEVIFAKRSDATKAVQKFNGLTLDGRPMEVVISDGPAGGNSNKAASFGSALHQPSFSVTLQDPILRQRNEGGMRDDRRVMLHPNDRRNDDRRNDDRRNDDRRNDDRRNDDRRGNGRGAEGRGEGQGRNERPRNDRKPRDGPRDKKDKPTPSMADLDSQLDAFRAGK